MDEFLLPARRRLVLASALALSCGPIPLVLATFGVFLLPLASSFELSRGAIAGALTVHVLVSAVSMPIAGRLVDRYGARRVASISFPLFAIAYAAQGFSGGSLTKLYLISAATALFGAGVSPVAFTREIVRNFESRRGLALGIALSGIGLGSALAPLAAERAIAEFGLRGAYIVLAILPLIIGFAGSWLLPRSSSSQPEPGRANNSGDLAGALVTRSFWQIGLAFMLVGIGYTGISIHLVPMLVDRGLSLGEASFAPFVAGIAVILGRLVSGWLLDRFPASAIATTAILLTAGGALVVVLAPLGWVVVGAAMLGLSAGAEIDVLAYIVARRFRQSAFATLYGLQNSIYFLGIAVGPVLVAVLRDWGGDYVTALPLIVSTLVLAALLIAVLPSQMPISR